jgi:hypothetical protein
LKQLVNDGLRCLFTVSNAQRSLASRALIAAKVPGRANGLVRLSMYSPCASVDIPGYCFDPDKSVRRKNDGSKMETLRNSGVFR